MGFGDVGDEPGAGPYPAAGVPDVEPGRTGRSFAARGDLNGASRYTVAPSMSTSLPPFPTAAALFEAQPPATVMDAGPAAVAVVAQVGVVQAILDVVCQTTGMGFAAIARVTERQWIACAVRDAIAFGLQPGGELVVETTICNEIRNHRRAVAIDDVPCDAIFRDHATPRRYGFRSYISVPIVLPGGEFFGTLCAIDPQPAKVNNSTTLTTFGLFADLIAQHLDGLTRSQANAIALADERETAYLRDRFMAILGHDLRNPLAAISGGAELLSRMPHVRDQPASANIARIIHRSAKRMGGLISDVLDFARGKLGGGFRIERRPDVQLAATLQQVVHELRTVHPDRTIDAVIQIDPCVDCDGERIAQLLSNLLSNALVHGDPARPVSVRVMCLPEQALELSVTNNGPTIPPERTAQLFEPFARGDIHKRDGGLGLGLFIASQIAKAHGGTLSVRSADGETCFTFRMPLLSDQV